MTALTPFAFRRNLFNKKTLANIRTGIDTSIEYGFYKTYQSRVGKANEEFYTLRTLLEAVQNSEAKFKQYPVDERSVKAIAKSVFVETVWLQRDPTIALVGSDVYVVGGRHRLNAIACTIASLVLDELNQEQYTDEAKQELFDEYLNQYLRVEVLHLADLEDLLLLIQTDNQSRTMRAAEKAHMQVQNIGADNETFDSVGKAVLTTELTPKEAKTLAAQAFTRRSHKKLKPQTLQVIGEKIASFVLYGVCPGDRLSAKAEILVKSYEEFNTEMDRAYEMMCSIIEGEAVIARNATEIVERVIRELSLEDDMFSNPEPADTAVHEFEREPVVNTRKGAKDDVNF